MGKGRRVGLVCVFAKRTNTFHTGEGNCCDVKLLIRAKF